MSIYKNFLLKLVVKRFIDNFAKQLNNQNITHVEVALEDIEKRYLKAKGKQFDLDFNQLIDNHIKKIFLVLRDAQQMSLK